MGIINNQMPPESAPMATKPMATKMRPDEMMQAEPMDGQAKKSGSMSGVEKVLPPELQEAFERTVLAGKKIMYSPNMEDTIRETMTSQDSIELKLAKSIVGLMAILDRQAKPRLPVQIIVPATIELVHDAADFVQNAGLAKVTPEQLKTATQLAVMITLKRYGMPDAQIGQTMRGEAKQQPNATPAPAAMPAGEEMPNA